MFGIIIVIVTVGVVYFLYNPAKLIRALISDDILLFIFLLFYILFVSIPNFPLLCLFLLHHRNTLLYLLFRDRTILLPQPLFLPLPFALPYDHPPTVTRL